MVVGISPVAFTAEFARVLARFGRAATAAKIEVN